MAKLSVQLVDSKDQIEKKIRAELLKEVNRVMDSAINRTVKPIRILVKDTLMNQPEVTSLDGRQLAGEFGLSDGGQRIENIIDYWVNNIIVSKKRATASGSQLDASFTIKMIRSDYEDVLASNEATVTTTKGQELPWLEWLLKFGDRAIVREYDVRFGINKRSRSGVAFMVRSKRSWGVPPQFAGTADNNFVTRALDSIEDEIISIFENSLRKLI